MVYSIWRKNTGETYEERCIREVREETGYDVIINKRLFEKNTKVKDIVVIVKYFEVNLIGGEEIIQDPDDLIYDVSWKSEKDIRVLKMTYPEDRKLLIELLKQKRKL